MGGALSTLRDLVCAEVERTELRVEAALAAGAAGTVAAETNSAGVGLHEVMTLCCYNHHHRAVDSVAQTVNKQVMN